MVGLSHRIWEKCGERVGCWRRKQRCPSGRLGTGSLGLAGHVGSWREEKWVLLGMLLLGRETVKLAVGSSKCGGNGIMERFMVLSRVPFCAGAVNGTRLLEKGW